MFDIECRFRIFFSRKLEIGIPITFAAFRILLEEPRPSQQIQAFFGLLLREVFRIQRFQLT